jgi:hypothetical protein
MKSNYNLGHWYQLKEFFRLLSEEEKDIVTASLSNSDDPRKLFLSNLNFLEEKKNSKKPMTFSDNQARKIAAAVIFCLAFEKPDLFDGGMVSRVIASMPSDYSREAIQVVIQAIPEKLRASPDYACNLAEACSIFGYKDEIHEIHNCAYSSEKVA